MADYVPLFLPGQAIPRTASATITGGQPVYVSGSGTVANSGAAANIPIGVAAFDAANGDRVTVFSRGTVHRLTASGTVTAGDLVEAAASGAGATHTVGTTDGRVFGIALTTATTGNSVEIMEV
jgi:hypothetical protein